MIYKDFKGLKLSALGMGMMRLPTTPDGKIDEDRTAEMIAYAIDQGVNYFDTAWGYHGGESELVAGKLLEKYPRESFYLASKFPGFDTEKMERVAEIFERQLEKCRVDYFDFYLFHNLCEANIDGYLDPKYGIFDYLMAQKKAGRIKHLGLSVHAGLETLKRFLEAYGKDMEFCQVQLNYLDYTYQKASDKLALLAEYGIPVWVMEPVRGGKLAELAAEDAAKLAALRPNESVPGWAFRYIQTLPNIGVTLSGMSNFEQLKQNIETFNTEQPLNEEELSTLYGIADYMMTGRTVPCTACRYCIEKCPQELDIPLLLKAYNGNAFVGTKFDMPNSVKKLDESKRPSACIGCQSCESVCPQQIKIAETMADFVRRMK